MTSKFITVDPEIQSGAPVFAGTRVPIKTLFDHLETGDAIAVFLDDYPSSPCLRTLALPWCRMRMLLDGDLRRRLRDLPVLRGLHHAGYRS